MKTLHSKLLVGLTALLSCVLTQAADGAGAAADALHWAEKSGEHIELRLGEQPVVRYMLAALDDSSPEAREKTYKPFLHVFSPDGERLLTKGPGGLYTHHRGIFYGFNKITYGDGKKCDTWHCKGKAYQSHEAVIAQKVDGDTAMLVVTIDWHGAEGEVFATEERTMAITLVDGGLQIDFASTLAPVGDDPILLDGDPQHAGVQFRASQHVAEKTKGQTYYVRTDGKGKSGETRNWDHTKPGAPMNPECTNRSWNAMSMVVDDQRYTVVYIDRRDNPKPSRYSERDYGRFGSYFVAEATAEEPLEVAYRFVVKEGELSVEECEKLHVDFATAGQ